VTPLQEAVRSRRDACADALVAAGGDLGDFDMAVELNNAVLRNDTVHLSRLIRCRCDLNSHDDYRRTALHVAVSCKRATAAHFLLEQAGINVNAEDVFGHTPLDDALRAEAGLSTQVLVVLVTASGGAPRRPRLRLLDVAARSPYLTHPPTSPAPCHAPPFPPSARRRARLGREQPRGQPAVGALRGESHRREQRATRRAPKLARRRAPDGELGARGGRGGECDARDDLGRAQVGARARPSARRYVARRAVWPGAPRGRAHVALRACRARVV
jgi:hypothetical protein